MTKEAMTASAGLSHARRYAARVGSDEQGARPFATVDVRTCATASDMLGAFKRDWKRSVSSSWMAERRSSAIARPAASISSVGRLLESFAGTVETERGTGCDEDEEASRGEDDGTTEGERRGCSTGGSAAVGSEQ